jgi:selenocysteine lyase/cysteine desulfurase
MAQLVNADEGDRARLVQHDAVAAARRGLAPNFKAGDEIVVTNLDHESNIAPWRELPARGVVVREWRFCLASGTTAAGLRRCFRRTRLVCFTQVSNLVERARREGIRRRIHAAGAMACVDGVAFAPHRRVDVRRSRTSRAFASS